MTRPLLVAGGEDVQAAAGMVAADGQAGAGAVPAGDETITDSKIAM
jgi:hypothetical protein